MVQGMKRRMVSEFRQVGGVCGLLVLFCLVVAARSGAEEPSPAAVSAFNAYVRGVEARLAGQPSSPVWGRRRRVMHGGGTAN